VIRNEKGEKAIPLKGRKVFQTVFRDGRRIAAVE
jgi:hypothetical protein